jgi:predicted transcriptional regulator
MNKNINAAVDAAVARIKREQETKAALAQTAIEYRAERDRKEKTHAKGGNSNGDAGKKTGNDSTRFNWRDNVYTAAELQRRTFPPVSYCVPDLIPEGLTIIAGKPKIGKSWLALDVCIAVAGGRFCLGERKPVQGSVLYAAMEDNPRRLQRRITRLLATFNDQWPEPLTLANSWRRLDKGGVGDIGQWIEQVDNPRLVILDTLASVKPIRTQQGYTEDYESLAALHRLANETGVSIILLHHTRKMEADDPVDTVSGTLGLAGCADSVLVLNRSSQGTTLYVRGRDIEETESAITFDRVSCRWTILGDASEVLRSNERKLILTALEQSGDVMSPQEIATRTGMTPQNVWQTLHRMAEDGQITKVGRGKYRHPDANADPLSGRSGSQEAEKKTQSQDDGHEPDILTNLTGPEGDDLDIPPILRRT